jgi:hypothetical protein
VCVGVSHLRLDAVNYIEARCPSDAKFEGGIVTPKIGIPAWNASSRESHSGGMPRCRIKEWATFKVIDETLTPLAPCDIVRGDSDREILVELASGDSRPLFPRHLKSSPTSAQMGSR